MSIVGVNASQLYPLPMSQDMSTGLYTGWELDADMQKFNARHNISRNFEKMVISFYQKTRPDCKIESFFTSRKQKKIDCLNVVVIMITVKNCSEQWNATSATVPDKKLAHP